MGICRKLFRSPSICAIVPLYRATPSSWLSAATAVIIFQIGDNSFGFVGHPGIKSAMIEDLIMEFDEVPEGTPEMLSRLRAEQGDIAAALAEMMIGLVEMTDLMEPSR